MDRRTWELTKGIETETRKWEMKRDLETGSSLGENGASCLDSESIQATMAAIISKSIQATWSDLILRLTYSTSSNLGRWDVKWVMCSIECVARVRLIIAK
jgi:HD superfamily phosphohydrolase